MDEKTLSYIVTFFYGNIKGIVEGMIGSVMGLPVDVVLAIIGWYLAKNTRYKWLGEGLLYGAVAELGATYGLGIFSLAQPKKPQAQARPVTGGVIW